MKYIKLGTNNGITSHWAIEQFSHIPSNCGEDVISIMTLSGTVINLYGGKNCKRFLKEFEDPNKLVLDWTSEEVNKTKEEFQRVMDMKALSYYDTDDNLLFEY